jgi:hypothetical protein
MTTSVEPRRPVATLAVIAIFVVFGLGLVLQPQRWHNTPSYANLLVIMSAPAWGAVYFVIAVVLIASVLLRSSRMLAISAHTLAFLLLLTWEAAFVVRWATDAGTTVVNVISWATYLSLVVYSARCIDTDEPEGGIALDST